MDNWCQWCRSVFIGQILIESVCLACLVEDIVDLKKLKKINPNGCKK